MEKAIDSFYAYDAAGFAANFTEDGILINPLGMMFTGPAMIQAVHEEVFQSWGEAPTNIQHNQTNKMFRTLCEDLVQLSFTHESKGNPSAGEGQMTFALLFSKENGEWLIKSAQLTPVIPVPQGN